MQASKRNRLDRHSRLIERHIVGKSFAHGANDTANSTAAFTSIIGAYTDGIHACRSQFTPVWVMAVAGAFVMLGIWTIGYRVIERVGSK